MKKLSLLQKQTVLFGEKEVRRTWHNEQWYFSISDVVQVLTDSNDVKQYIKKMRIRDNQLSVNWGTICTPLQMMQKKVVRLPTIPVKKLRKRLVKR